jgi:monovalent cation/proton antiporter MnhG/PhaG subunit
MVHPVLVQSILWIGVFFTVVGALGVFRFGDVYLRIQASSKALTFGFGFIMLGVGLAGDDWRQLGKSLLAVLFMYLTSPLAAQLIAHAALYHMVVTKDEPTMPPDLDALAATAPTTRDTDSRPVPPDAPIPRG